VSPRDEVTEFVGDRRDELRPVGLPQDRVAEGEHAPAPEAEGSADLGDEGVRVGDETDLVRRARADLAGDVRDEGEERGLGGGVEDDPGEVAVLLSTLEEDTPGRP
jgi:hypothetical protein